MTDTARQLAGLIMEADLPQRALERVAALERMDWRRHIKAAVTDLRNSDRSPFEQQVYDALRSFADLHC